MPKRLYKYRGFDGAAIKAKANIPSYGDMTVVSYDVDCSNISLAAVKNILSAITFSLSELCRHINVNPWSNFSPTIRTYTNQGTLNAALVNSAPTTAYSLGSFAGYYKDAVAPGWDAGELAKAEADIWCNAGTKPEFNATVRIGEINYTGGTHAVLTIFDGAMSIIASTGVDLNTLADPHIAIIQATAINNMSNQTSCTGQIHICSDDEVGPNTPGENAICKVPNTTSYNVIVKMIPATWLDVESGGFLYLGNPIADGNDVSFNLTTGNIVLAGNGSHTSSFSNLLIKARIFQMDSLGNYNQVGSDVTCYDDSYSANTILSDLIGIDLAPNVYPGGGVPAYGWRFELVIEHTL